VCIFKFKGVDMSYFKKRAKEPSTWAGVAGVFQALAFFFPAHAAALNGLTAVAGCIAAQLPERGADAAQGVEHGRTQ
jgi:hypothetical protein